MAKDKKIITEAVVESTSRDGRQNRTVFTGDGCDEQGIYLARQLKKVGDVDITLTDQDGIDIRF